MPNDRKEKSDLTSKDAYEEIGRNYRVFLNWRNALVAGYLVLLGAIGKAILDSCNQQQYVAPFALCIFLFVITKFIYELEVRNRDLYHYCIQQGEAIEAELKIEGIYIRLNELNVKAKNKNRYSHSSTIDWFFKFWLVVSVIGFAVFLGILLSRVS